MTVNSHLNVVELFDSESDFFILIQVRMFGTNSNDYPQRMFL